MILLNVQFNFNHLSIKLRKLTIYLWASFQASVEFNQGLKFDQENNWVQVESANVFLGIDI